MKIDRKKVLVIGGLAAAATLALARLWAQGTKVPEESKAGKSMLRTWFEHLKQGLSESAVQKRYQKTRVTAVAAVRGERQDAVDPDKPHWKQARKTRESAALKKQRAEFGQAVDLILEGKVAEGLEALDAFEKAHPRSSLLPDVKAAREKARQLTDS